MSTKTIDNFNLYTFHLMDMNLKRHEHSNLLVVQGQFLIKSSKNKNETKLFSFRRMFKMDKKGSRSDWSIRSLDKLPVGEELLPKFYTCLDKIVEQFGQVIPADDSFEFDFDTEVVLGQQLN